MKQPESKRSLALGLLYAFVVGSTLFAVAAPLPPLLLCLMAFLSVFAFFTVSAAFFVGGCVLTMMFFFHPVSRCYTHAFFVLAICAIAIARPFDGKRTVSVLIGALGLVVFNNGCQGIPFGLTNAAHLFFLRVIIFSLCAFLLYSPWKRLEHPTDYICFSCVAPLVFFGYYPPFGFMDMCCVLAVVFACSLFRHKIPSVFVLFVMSVMCVSRQGFRDVCGLEALWYATGCTAGVFVSSASMMWCARSVPVKLPLRLMAFMLFCSGTGGIWFTKIALYRGLSLLDQFGRVAFLALLGLTQGSYLWQCYNRKEPLPHVHYARSVCVLFCCVALVLSVYVRLIRSAMPQLSIMSLGLYVFYLMSVYSGWVIRRRVRLAVWNWPKWRLPVWKPLWPNGDASKDFLDKMWHHPGWTVVFCVGFAALWWSVLCML